MMILFIQLVTENRTNKTIMWLAISNGRGSLMFWNVKCGLPCCGAQYLYQWKHASFNYYQELVQEIGVAYHILNLLLFFFFYIILSLHDHMVNP